ncbi:MAG: DUF1549 domain-containing protein, partial [Proteobacteria bacterium]|nr:DUF1549 domain-containing protein [Pseudomonadota bacterium]
MDGMVTSTSPALTTFGLKFNTKAEYVSDLNVRKAISYAYDYDAFIKIFNGRAKLQTSPFSDAIKGKINIPSMPTLDLAKAKEYLAKYTADRVRTASAVWLGSTVGCSECHDHKFDPFTTRDFYRFASFFADIKERGLYSGANRSGAWGPKVVIPNQQLPGLLKPVDQRLAELQKIVDTPTDKLATAQKVWERKLSTTNADQKVQKTQKSKEPPENIQKILAIAADKRNDEQSKT